LSAGSELLRSKPLLFWTPSIFWEQPFTPKTSLMPHHERACKPLLGSDDGKWIFEIRMPAKIARHEPQADAVPV